MLGWQTWLLKLNLERTTKRISPSILANPPSCGHHQRDFSLYFAQATLLRAPSKGFFPLFTPTHLPAGTIKGIFPSISPNLPSCESHQRDFSLYFAQSTLLRAPSKGFFPLFRPIHPPAGTIKGIFPSISPKPPSCEHHQGDFSLYFSQSTLLRAPSKGFFPLICSSPSPAFSSRLAQKEPAQQPAP
ncbi:hypothetical protein [Paenibacillus sp. FSL R7-0273]|uniref:hypothetical protein n=1 Tax=Paenibacillus sp. FSL R7-0273 TaxID=1536772 RepID=UPI00117FADE7|nr:hypothetical protein [Paenibacillus sp. FSL R7-0273]